MKRFEDFLLKHPIQRTTLSKTLLDEFEHSNHLHLNEQSRLLLAITTMLLKFFDMRLRDYHNWLHHPDSRDHL